MIPYEAQRDGNACGAACLCMVYRSLGLACAQAEVLAAVSRRGWRGDRCHTHMLCQDALSRGLAAVIVRASPDLAALRACLDVPLRIIVQHQLRRGEPSGHYSVLLDAGGDEIVLHDPLEGPSRRVTWREFQLLWQRCGEVAGQMMLAVAACSRAARCETCAAELPAEVPCRLCGKAVPLTPPEALGCLRESCPGRRWRSFFCPWCDYCFASPSGGLW